MNRYNIWAGGVMLNANPMSKEAAHTFALLWNRHKFSYSEMSFIKVYNRRFNFAIPNKYAKVIRDGRSD